VTTCKMIRWEYFYAMGNNCRLHGMATHEAQTVLDQVGMWANDAENFWTGFMYGRDNNVVSLPSINSVDAV
jgi:hypothetical protein